MHAETLASTMPHCTFDFFGAAAQRSMLHSESVFCDAKCGEADPYVWFTCSRPLANSSGDEELSAEDYWVESQRLKNARHGVYSLEWGPNAHAEVDVYTRVAASRVSEATSQSLRARVRDAIRGLRIE